MVLHELAPAKINLTLNVLGRRPDGYHEIDSLVAFARDCSDVVTLTPEPASAVQVDGPFGAAIVGPNLVRRAIDAVSALRPAAHMGRVTLEKNLPVASGVGGGSSNAAATLRLLRRHIDDDSALDWTELARSLGADVPVCFANRAAVMTGIGETVTEITFPDDVFVVLANPGVVVPADKTARVFASLARAPGAGAAPEPLRTRTDIEDAISHGRNDLQAAAQGVVPEIAECLSGLARLAGVAAVRLSGAGPTCFGVFRSAQLARAGAQNLAAQHPSWWIAASRLS